MQPPQSAWQPWRLGTFFAGYYAAAGVLAPYFPLYLEARGLTAAQIGLVVALAQGIRVVGPTAWGWLADHTAHRARILQSTTLLALVSFLPIVLPGGFGLVMAVMFVFHLFLAGQVPMAEAIAAVRLREDPQAAALYGRVRVWGSFGFIALVLATGPLLDATSVMLVPYLVIALLALTFAATLLVREVPPPDAAGEPSPVRARLREARVRWFFVSVLLMIFAHSALYAYLSLYLARLGYSTSAIGVFWTVGVVGEIAFFYVQGRLFARFELLLMLEVTLVLAAIRFFLIAEHAHVVTLLVLAQVLHAATFAAHHSASVLTIQRWFSGRAAARGQALYVSVGYGVGGSLGSLTAAWLWSALDPAAAFLSSSAAALLGWWAVRRARQCDNAVARLAPTG